MSLKLVLDDAWEEEFSLIAIHCSEEAYKMAYMLNKHLGLRLQRRRVDLDFGADGLELTYPLFQYDNKFQYCTYYLVANKCKSQLAQLSSAGGLFQNQEATKNITAYLMPEFKKVDFFLKIEAEDSTIPLRKTVAQLNEIKEVISSYIVENHTIKSTKNLIFH